MITDFKRALQILVDGEVEFIVIGGVAAALHGSLRLTSDVDVIYSRAPANISRLVAALAPCHPHLRGAPPGLPFVWDDQTVRMGLKLTLDTDFGQIDVLGEVAGGGTYERLLPRSGVVEAMGMRLRIVDIKELILLKRAAGRAKDMEAITKLKEIFNKRLGSAES